MADSVSLDNVSRSSTLRRQREAALRRRPNHNNVPIKIDGSVSSSSSDRVNSSTTVSAMADVMAWEEVKTKERLEARIIQEDNRRVEEARLRAERAKAAEEEAEAEQARRQEHRDLERKLAEERNAREEAAQRLKEEARQLAEIKAETER